MLWMLRNGYIKPEHIEMVNEDFSDLDADNNGVFTKSEMQASMFFERYDHDHDGNLTSSNMKEICLSLQKLPSVEWYGKMMLDPTIVYDQEKIEMGMLEYDMEVDVLGQQSEEDGKKVISLNRKEFMQWWSHEYRMYVGQRKTSMLSRMSVSMETLLRAIDLDNGSSDSGGGGVEGTKYLGK